MASLFELPDYYGEPCRCPCHPRLGDGRHDDGLVAWLGFPCRRRGHAHLLGRPTSPSLPMPST